MLIRFNCLIALIFSCCQVSASRAQSIPDYDFQWATVGAAGNPAYNGIAVSDLLPGRGSVGYEYRISKVEVTTAQWIEFLNTFADTTGVMDTATPIMPGAVNVIGDWNRWELNPDVANAAMVPVLGFTWRSAAMYCNWLHNDKAPTIEALFSGAYDLATTAPSSDQIVPISLERSPGA